MAAGANAEARFNAPPYQSELHEVDSSQRSRFSKLPGYLEFKPHHAVEFIIISVIINQLYNQKASQHKPELLGKSRLGGLLLGEAHRSLGALWKPSIV